MNVEESNGALLGRAYGFSMEGAVGTSTRGLEVNREEITWDVCGAEGAERGSSSLSSAVDRISTVRSFLDGL